MKSLINLTLLLGSLFGINNFISAQSLKDSLTQKNLIKPLTIDWGKDKEVQFVCATMVWDVFTFENAGTNEAERRNDIYIRRGRFGAVGKIRKNMSFSVTFTYDGIGKDKYTAADGIINADDNQRFYLRDAIYIWNAKPMFNLVFGYFRPQVGKETITSSFNVISFIKTFPSVQPRYHLLGRAIGRETGINIGGLHLDKGWSINYNIGLFDPTSPLIVGTGLKWSPLTTARVAFTVGDPEMTSYKIWYTQSYFGKRNGTTLGLNAAMQGETEIFKSNSMYSLDILSNYGRFDFNMEYDWLKRNSYLGDSTTMNTMDKILSVKLGYLIKLKNEQFLQPVIAYANEQPNNFGVMVNTNSLTGSVRQDIFDVGLNLFLNKEKFKISIHYIKGRRYDKIPDKNYSYIGTGFQFMY